LFRRPNDALMHVGRRGFLRTAVRYASTEQGESNATTATPAAAPTHTRAIAPAPKLGFIDRLISLLPRDAPLILAEVLTRACACACALAFGCACACACARVHFAPSINRKPPNENTHPGPRELLS
jgi:hypothetical protein